MAVLDQLCQKGTEFIEAEDANQVLGVIDSGIHLDLAILDLFMPGADGFELLSDLTARLDGIPIVVLSASEDRSHIRKTLDCGACGYITKSTPAALMIQAFRLILQGGMYFPVELVSTAHSPASCDQLPPDPTLGLTDRQLEVLSLMAKGRSNKMIARELGLSAFTVKTHVASILRTLQVANRVEAALVASRLGIDL
ncbi:response regulator transcription factor [Halochromatium roseum]|uniref:response regulator transcription factor n=1 Tax=Halochromatium roseum TaxID=391920 RepID=UPI00308418AF